MNDRSIALTNLSTKEAADYLGVSPGWLADLRDAGDGPVFRIQDQRIIYTHGGLDDWAFSRLGVPTCNDRRR